MPKRDRLLEEAVLKIGEVAAVEGQKVIIQVDKNKNSSELFYRGEILNNVAVNHYIEIRKGFLSLIGKVEGEQIDEKVIEVESNYQNRNRNRRFLNVKLVGFINGKRKFIGGLRELPLIGNEVFILTGEKLRLIHNLVVDAGTGIVIAKTDVDDSPIELPINGLFNTHIAIFGNTGSGKSNTTAALYKALFSRLEKRNKSQGKFLFIDFNGEYVAQDCLTRNKKVYKLSTHDDSGDKLPLTQKDLLDIEVLSVIANATEQTQKPFLKRAIRLYKEIHNDERNADESLEYFKNIVRKKVISTLKLKEKQNAHLLLDYFSKLLPDKKEDGEEFNALEGLEWQNKYEHCIINGATGDPQEEQCKNTVLYKQVDQFQFSGNLISDLICFLYIQLITDVLSNRAQNEHIAPVINRLDSKQRDIQKVFSAVDSVEKSFWARKSVAVVSLNNVNLEMKKTIPLLLCKKLYSDHKEQKGKRSRNALSIIIDEAHNILSNESFRETESWKAYRLETFEEIIKEGRKFGVFLTIASQRPSDISETITSQAHHYFIHRLINHKDLTMISKAVSYIDKITEDSIPVLPTGTCIFSGVSTQLPLKLRIDLLDKKHQPNSSTFEYDLTTDRDLEDIPVIGSNVVDLVSHEKEDVAPSVS